MIDRRAGSALAILARKSVTANDQEKAHAALEKAIEKHKDNDVRNLLREAFRWLSTYSDESRRLPGSEYLQSVRKLTAAGFTHSAEVLFVTFVSSFQGLDVQEVAAAAPTVKSVESLISASGGAEVRKTLEDFARGNAAKTYEAVLCDWLLSKSGPEKCEAFLERLLLRQPRPAFLPAWDQLLASLLASDNKGKSLELILRLSAGSSELLENLAVLLHSKPELLATVTDSLPALFRRLDQPGLVEKVIRGLFKDVHLTDDLKRRQSCAALARLGAGLLLEYPRVQDASEALKTVQELALALKASAVSDELKRSTWVFEHLGEKSETTTSGTHITRLGASHVAVAFSKASEGYAAKDILLMLAHNLGMTQVGEFEDLVSYDSLRHEDVAGGLLPGAPVKVTEPGWMLNEDVVVRAKVEKV